MNNLKRKALKQEQGQSKTVLQFFKKKIPESLDVSIYNFLFLIETKFNIFTICTCYTINKLDKIHEFKFQIYIINFSFFN